MSRKPCRAGALLAAAAMLATDGALAQARGSSVREMRETGQTIERIAPDRREFLAAISRQYGLDPEELESGELKLVPDKGWVLQRGDEQIELLNLRRPEVLDESARAAKHAEQAAWLGHLVGRFRIGGRVEKRGIVMAEVVSLPSVSIPTTLEGEVNGVADCAAVGTGAGVHCVFNATWPIIEPITGPASKTIGPPEPSERVRLLRPAVVVLGLNPDTAEIRASMVTDDSVAHTWAGRLETHTLTARRLTSCFVSQGVTSGSPPPCYQPLEIVAEPGSGIVTMVHRAVGVTIRLILQRDPAASAEKPMKSKRVR
jgi:hypothetical protein